MDDKELSIGATECAAWIGWLLAVSGVIAGWALGVNPLGQLGIVSAGAAATLHVRSFLCKQTGLMRAAYDIGKEHGMAQAGALKRIPSQTNGRSASLAPQG